MLAINQIHNLDFHEGIKQIPDQSVDLCVTDPPYLWNKTTGGLSTTSVITSKWKGKNNLLLAGGKTASMDNEIKFHEWLPHLYRVMRSPSHCYIFVNDKNLFDIQQEAMKVGFKLHNILVWKKNNKTPNLWYMKDCEFVVFLRKGKSFRINKLGSSQALEFENVMRKNRIHPTQKPVPLLKHLIENSSQAGQLVFDPFMGSGSTAIACIETGRNFLGLEINPKFHELAIKRLDAHQVKR